MTTTTPYQLTYEQFLTHARDEEFLTHLRKLPKREKSATELLKLLASERAAQWSHLDAKLKSSGD